MSPLSAPCVSGSPSEASGSVDSTSLSFERPPLRLRPPRSLPPWIDSYEQSYGPAANDQLRLLDLPTRILQPQRNAIPSELQRRVSTDGFVAWEDPLLGPAKDTRAKISHVLRHGWASMRGRKWDHLRSSEPVIVAHHCRARTRSGLAWQEFIYASAWGRMPNETSEIVDYEALRRFQSSFNQAYDVRLHPSNPQPSRRCWSKTMYKRVWSAMMRNSLPPLLFRLIVMITSILALGIAAPIFQAEDAIDRASAERTQSTVAIVVDCIAIPYLGYMIWDEYTGKPVGLRSGVSKIWLILDLFFIIFKSASTALAFESLVYRNSREDYMLHLSMVLGAFELIGLVSWTMTFTINVFRTVERLGGG